MKQILKRFMAVAIMAVMVNVSVVSAASTGVFTSFTMFNNNISEGKYGGQQGMCIDRFNSDAYFIRTDDSGNAQLVVTNYRNKNSNVYPLHDESNKTVTKIFGHGNDLAVVSKSGASTVELYVATMKEGKYANQVLKLIVNRNKSDRSKYKYKVAGYYDFNRPVYGIAYSVGNEKFIVKVEKTKYFIGTFGSNHTFKKQAEFNINISSVKVGNKTENYSSYTGQGVCFYKGVFYVPLWNSKTEKDSVVLCYKLNPNKNTYSTLQPMSNLCFKASASVKIEIESVDLCDGILYFNTNYGGKDFLGKFNGYVAAESV